MSMKTLFWKDYRQSQKILIACGIIVAMPYFIVIALSWPPLPPGESVSIRIAVAATYALMLSAGMAAFLSGNAIAGERSDRSAEFAAYLPIPRRDRLISKAAVALVMSGGLLLFNVEVVRVAAPLHFAVGENGTLVARNSFASAVLLFGVAWLFSSVTSSPAISAATSLATLFALASTLAIVDGERHVLPGFPSSLFDWYPTICIAAGPAAFLAGSVYYLRTK